MKKRAILTLLAFVLSCTTFFAACKTEKEPSGSVTDDSTITSDEPTGSADNSGENTKENNNDNPPPAEGSILELATMVSEGFYKLKSDVTVTKTYMGTFSGVLDGAGFTVTTTMPLFLKLEDATIDNIVITGEINSCPDDAMGWTGALACMANGASVMNSVNKTKIDDKTDSITHSSGFIGVTTGGVVAFENCRNEGEIIGSSAAAGMISQAKYAEGAEITFKACTNTGAIKCSNGPAGGILGFTGMKDGSSVEGVSTSIVNCTNTAEITSKNNKAGGIFGGLEGGTPDFYVVGCSNSGNITSNCWAGGIGGKVQISRARLGRKIFTIEKCGNSGKIVAIKAEGDKYSDYDSPCVAGGILGMFLGKEASMIKMNYCYNVGDVHADASNGKASTSYTLQNWAAGLCNVYQLRVATALNPVDPEPASPDYDTSCFKLCYVSGKISVATIAQTSEAENKYAAMLVNDLFSGTYVWTDYKKQSMFQNNFIDTSKCELPTVNADSEAEGFELADYDAALIIAEGTLGTTFVNTINEKCGTNVYTLGEGGFPVIAADQLDS